MSEMSYELTQEDVLGVEMTVFKERHRSLRELLDASLQFGDQDYIVDGHIDQAGRRISYAAHHAALSCSRS